MSDPFCNPSKFICSIPSILWFYINIFSTRIINL
jgi:hypothetical protein